MSPKRKKQKKPVSHSLKDLARRELSVELDKEHQKADWGGEITPEMLEYAAKDSQVLLPLAETLEVRIREDNLEAVLDLERRVTLAMAWMSAAGVPIDEKGWRDYREQMDGEVKQAKEKLDELAPDHPDGKPWNWNSWQQTLEAFELLGLRLPNTREETLSTVDHPLAVALLDYRNAKKRLDVCNNWLSRAHEGRVYGSWNPVGAETGRMTCKEPNLQNLHKGSEMRELVRAPEGRRLVKADYSQMELRILAQISGDPAMIEAFEKGEDLHRATAAKMYGIPEEEVTDEQRSSAKAISFGIVYGMTSMGLAVRLGTEEEQAEKMIEQYFAAYPGVEEYLETNATEALRTGMLRTLIGRIRRFGDAHAMTRRERNEVRRQAKNFPIQGACVDGLKAALALLWDRREECPGAMPVLAVHDEIVVECPEEQAEEVKAWLERAMVDGMEEVLEGSDQPESRVPVEVETRVSKTWAG